MKAWRILSKESEAVIDIDKLTVFKNHTPLCYELCRSIDDFFNNKNSEIEIYEDETLLHKKDWDCFFITYDSKLSLEKLTAKSPLIPLMNRVVDRLSYSPVFMEISELWEELKEEVEMNNHELSPYRLRASLEPFESKDFRSFLSLSLDVPLQTPYQYKKLLLSLIEDLPMEKKMIVILEMPELFTTAEELQELHKQVSRLSKKGIQFVISTSSAIWPGAFNQFYKGALLNRALMNSIKDKVIHQSPFYCDEQLFLQAYKSLSSAVDKVPDQLVLGDFEKEEEKIKVLEILISRELNIGMDLDITSFSSAMKVFIKDLKLNEFVC